MTHQVREDVILAIKPERLKELNNEALRGRLRGMDAMIVEYREKLKTLVTLEMLLEAEIRARGFTVEEFSRMS